MKLPYERPLGNLYTRADVDSLADLVRSRGALKPEIAFFIGTGFSQLAEEIADPVSIPFSDLPGLPQPGIPGHVGEIVIGRLAGRVVACARGKIQLLDGHPAQLVVLPLRLFAVLGCRSVLYTNTVGAINPRFRPGDFVAVVNHINLTGANPLVGEPESEWGTRFFDLTHPYDLRLTSRLKAIAAANNIDLHEGVYLGVTGPSFETASEIRMGARLGADLVGMSTVQEAIAARQLRMPMVCFSFVSNMAAGVEATPVDNEDILRIAAGRYDRFRALILGMLPNMP